ncbi:MAG: hypothetical protein LQ342_003007 [Letrouitia transgressa]|nr:MAG: hypothetical protein LQ342_003007 [Letrouitia transgressa]
MPPVTAARDASYVVHKVVCFVASFVLLMFTKDVVIDRGLVPWIDTLTAPALSPAPATSWTGMKETIIVGGLNVTDHVSFDMPLLTSPHPPPPPPTPPPPPPPPSSIPVALVQRFLRLVTIFTKNVATGIRDWARLIDTHTPGVEPPNVYFRQSERRGRRWRHHKASLHTKPGVRFPWKLPVVQKPTNGALVPPARLPALPANIMWGIIRSFQEHIRYLQRHIRPQAEFLALRAELQNEKRDRKRLEEELAALKEENARRTKAHEAKKSSFNPAAASFQPSARPPPPPPPPASLSTTPPIPRVAWKTGEQEMQSFVRLYPQHGKKMGE